MLKSELLRFRIWHLFALVALAAFTLWLLSGVGVRSRTVKVLRYEQYPSYPNAPDGTKPVTITFLLLLELDDSAKIRRPGMAEFVKVSGQSLNVSEEGREKVLGSELEIQYQSYDFMNRKAELVDKVAVAELHPFAFHSESRVTFLDVVDHFEF